MKRIRVACPECGGARRFDGLGNPDPDGPKACLHCGPDGKVWHHRLRVRLTDPIFLPAIGEEVEP